MFTDQETLIFPYQDGERDADGSLRWVHGDPLQITLRVQRAVLEDNLKEIQEQIDRAAPEKLEDDSPNPAHDPGMIAVNMERLVPIVQRIFEITPLDKATGIGLTWDQTMDVMRSFNRFKGALKKNGGDSPATSQPMDGTPAVMAAPSPNGPVTQGRAAHDRPWKQQIAEAARAIPEIPETPPMPTQTVQEPDMMPTERGEPMVPPGILALMRKGQEALKARAAMQSQAAAQGPSLIPPTAASNGIAQGSTRARPLPWPVALPQPTANQMPGTPTQ